MESHMTHVHKSPRYGLHSYRETAVLLQEKSQANKISNMISKDQLWHLEMSGGYIMLAKRNDGSHFVKANFMPSSVQWATLPLVSPHRLLAECLMHMGQKWKHLRSFKVVIILVEFYRISARRVLHYLTFRLETNSLFYSFLSFLCIKRFIYCSEMVL